MNFSKNLRDYLNSKDLSINELARRLEVPVSTIHGWLNGVEPKNMRDLKKVSVFLGITIDELCFGEVKTYVKTDIRVSIGEDSFHVYLSKVEKIKDKV
jgi:transcriptional regulator with XRE-family HTH domain